MDESSTNSRLTDSLPAISSNSEIIPSADTDHMIRSDSVSVASLSADVTLPVTITDHPECSNDVSYQTVVAVSYTHLTLPTNREV